MVGLCCFFKPASQRTRSQWYVRDKVEAPERPWQIQGTKTQLKQNENEWFCYSMLLTQGVSGKHWVLHIRQTHSCSYTYEFSAWCAGKGDSELRFGGHTAGKQIRRTEFQSLPGYKMKKATDIKIRILPEEAGELSSCSTDPRVGQATTWSRQPAFRWDKSPFPRKIIKETDKKPAWCSLSFPLKTVGRGWCLLLHGSFLG